jgi:hypothetical protein
MAAPSSFQNSFGGIFEALLRSSRSLRCIENSDRRFHSASRCSARTIIQPALRQRDLRPETGTMFVSGHKSERQQGGTDETAEVRQTER